MENKLNSKDQKRLVEALARMQADMDEMRRKHELARWATEIQVPFTLGEMLPSFTKTDLDRVRQSIRVRGLSALNKQKLAGALTEAIVGNAPRLFLLLDTSQYDLLKRVVDNGGIIDEFTIDDDQVEYFRDRGILFPGTCKGKRVLAAAKEMVAEFRKTDGQKLRDSARRNTEWIRLAHGLLYYYGILPFTILTGKIASLSKVQPVDTVRIVEVLLENALPYHGRMRNGAKGVSSVFVSDPAAVAREHAARPGVDYYPFQYDEIWRAGDENFVDKNIAFKRLSRFIVDHYDITAQEADDLVEECVWIIQDPEEPNRQMSEIFEFLQSRLEFPSREIAQQIAHYLMELNNHTRQWSLKGHTPDELFQTEQKHLRPLPSGPFSMPGNMGSKTVGRNAPCPCGSGKKYKKCCGRDE